MRIPYLKRPVFLNEAGELLCANGQTAQLNAEQRTLIERVLAGGCDVEDLARLFGAAFRADPARVRGLIEGFLASLEGFGLAELDVPDRVDAAIVDRGWGGVFQNAIDLWTVLNRRHRTLLLAPVDPSYGYDPRLSPLLITPGRWGGSGELIEFLSIARTVLKKCSPGVILLTHRAVAPFFFDIARERPLIVHGDDYSESSLLLGRHLAPEAPRQDLAQVLQRLYHGPAEPWASLLHAQAYYWTFRHAAETWSWTGRQHANALRYAPELAARFRLVLPMIDTDLCHPAETAAPASWILFTTTAEPGRVGSKGLDPLLGALPSLPEQARLRIVLDSAACAPADLGQWGERVQLRTRVPKEEMVSLYREAVVNCRVSKGDSSPVSLLESMACGVPVIVSPLVAGNLGIVNDGVNGFIVDPEDVGTLAARLRLLVENPDLRQRLGGHAREAVMQHSLGANLHLLTRYCEGHPDCHT